ncbi:SDR family oxidoreductase [Robiginitomaculum antarcticum]|uniref:SDR family oxidoreductase n=1 Tax=Robiginitomaculum antarcticum TaxID=437507 RepID=UPI000369F27F|nr:SDR family oxidoreductase [Robiginitomaculum antarcticum]
MFSNKIVAITGAAGGIGLGIAKMFANNGARVALSDLKAPEAQAKELGGKAYVCDVSSEASVTSFIEAAEADLGPIDIYISNAGVGFGDGPNGEVAGGSNKSWETSWQVNVMGSVYAVRDLVPKWIERGGGRFVITASAAGLLNQIGSASYSATKHAAVGLAEAIAIAHRADNIFAHCICPQYVRSNMTKGQKFAEESKDGLLEPSDVAAALKNAIANDEFLVLSHPVVGEYFKGKASDYNRYIHGMAKLKSKIAAEDLPLQNQE